MTTTKILASVSVLLDQGYKFSYFCESLSKHLENQLGSVKTVHKVLKMLKTWFKKDTFHIEMFEHFCPQCSSKFVIENGVKERKLIFYDKGVVKLKFRLINVTNPVKNSIRTFLKFLRIIVISHMNLRVNVLN